MRFRTGDSPLPTDTTVDRDVVLAGPWHDPAPPPPDLMVQMVLCWVADDRRDLRRALGLHRPWLTESNTDL
jgi:hypothetical protein